MSTEHLPELVLEALTHLRAIEPNRAIPNDIRRCEAALAAVDRSEHLGVWLEIQTILASFLLEARVGDHSGNVARAASIYSGILEAGVRETHPRAWDVAVIGFANCLTANPNSPTDAFQRCYALLDDLLAHRRDDSDAERLAIVLSCYANVLKVSPSGNRDDNLERALALCLEEISVLGSGERYPVRWARAQHNLGGLYAARRIGGRSQNVDDAIRALRVALDWRSRESDPGGRA